MTWNNLKKLQEDCQSFDQFKTPERRKSLQLSHGRRKQRETLEMRSVTSHQFQIHLKSKELSCSLTSSVAMLQANTQRKPQKSNQNIFKKKVTFFRIFFIKILWWWWCFEIMLVRELIREAVIKGVGDERDHTVARKKKTKMKMGGREYGQSFAWWRSLALPKAINLYLFIIFFFLIL